MSRVRLSHGVLPEAMVRSSSHHGSSSSHRSRVWRPCFFPLQVVDAEALIFANDARREYRLHESRLYTLQGGLLNRLAILREDQEVVFSAKAYRQRVTIDHRLAWR